MFNRDKKSKKDRPEEKPMLLTREDILGADDLDFEYVDVPEWGGTVKIRALTSKEKDLYQISLIKNPGKSEEINLANATAKLVALSIIDEEGRSVFGTQDVIALGQKSGSALSLCYEACQRLSAVSDQDIKDLTENLADGQSVDSISD